MSDLDDGFPSFLDSPFFLRSSEDPCSQPQPEGYESIPMTARRVPEQAFCCTRAGPLRIYLFKSGCNSTAHRLLDATKLAPKQRQRQPRGLSGDVTCRDCGVDPHIYL